jgi:hypothetical protein
VRREAEGGGRAAARRVEYAAVGPLTHPDAAPQGAGAWVQPHPRGKAVGPASAYACAHDR